MRPAARGRALTWFCLHFCGDRGEEHWGHFTPPPEQPAAAGERSWLLGKASPSANREPGAGGEAAGASAEELAASPALISPHTLSSERASGNQRKTKQEFTKPQAAQPGHRSSAPPAANTPRGGQGSGTRVRVGSGQGHAAGAAPGASTWRGRAGAQGSLRSSHFFLLIHLSSDGDDGDGAPGTAWLGTDSPCPARQPHTSLPTWRLQIPPKNHPKGAGNPGRGSAPADTSPCSSPGSSGRCVLHAGSLSAAKKEPL